MKRAIPFLAFSLLDTYASLYPFAFLALSNVGLRYFEKFYWSGLLHETLSPIVL